MENKRDNEHFKHLETDIGHYIRIEDDEFSVSVEADSVQDIDIDALAGELARIEVLNSLRQGHGHRANPVMHYKMRLLNLRSSYLREQKGKDKEES